jgi:hypothetical protein
VDGFGCTHVIWMFEGLDMDETDHVGYLDTIPSTGLTPVPASSATFTQHPLCYHNTTTSIRFDTIQKAYGRTWALSAQ